MRCPYCGNVVSGAATRCTDCGGSLAEQREEQQRVGAAGMGDVVRRVGRPPLGERLGLRGLAGVVVLIVIVIVALIALALQPDTGGDDPDTPWDESR